jgi:hypothetical protein
LRDFARSTHNTVSLIEILATQAMLHEHQGQIETALGTLEEAVTLAQLGGFIRYFVDCGPQLKPLLQELGSLKV